MPTAQIARMLYAVGHRVQLNNRDVNGKKWRRVTDIQSTLAIPSYFFIPHSKRIGQSKKKSRVSGGEVYLWARIGFVSIWHAHPERFVEMSLIGARNQKLFQSVRYRQNEHGTWSGTPRQEFFWQKMLDIECVWKSGYGSCCGRRWSLSTLASQLLRKNKNIQLINALFSFAIMTIPAYQ